MMKFENLKMQNKLLMMFFITGILPIFVIAIYVLYKGEGNIKEEVKKSNILYANLSKDSLNRYFNERKVNGEVLANTKRLHEGLIYYNQNGDGRDWEMHYKSIDDALLYALKMYGYTDIFSTDIKGNVVYSATLKKELENVNLDDREYIKTSMKGVQNWSDLFYSEYVMDEILVLSTPVYETNNHKLIGTINMMINQDKLDEMISQGLEILGASADIYVINETGLLLSDAKQGEYKDGILKKSIQTKAYEQLKGPIVDKDLNFIDMYEYKNYMGNLVYGSLTTVMFGDAIEGLVIEVGKDEVLKHAEELRIDVYISLVAIAILGTLIAIFISRVIVIAFNKLINNLNTIANLDMTVEIDDKYLKRKDEIGKISNTMRDMTKNMREMVIKVSNSSERLAAASEELTATSDQAVTSAQEISKTVEDIAKGATSQAENTAEGSEKLNKLGSLMDEDQKYMMNLNDASLKINKVVNEGLEVVDNLTKKTKTSESAIKSVYDKIIKTNKSSENIGETSKVINTIAEQTNLLALNAAIEAARAGEHGKGFAVVAEEIRKLAEQSTDSTKIIDNAVDALKGDSKESVETIKEVLKVIEEQIESVKITEKKYSEISEGIKVSDRAIENLNGTSKEMIGNKENILKIMQDLSAIAQENAASTEEVSASAEEQVTSFKEVSAASMDLATLAQELQKAISKFKV